MPAPVLSSFRKQTISNIFIGIDFGTSYTKVSYSYAPTQTPQIETIDWNNDYFKQTILYIQNGKLYFDKPEGNYKEVKYFKYSIVESELKNNNEITKNNFEEMCCVYFLAQIIKRSLLIIQEKLRIKNIDEIRISVNMGVPLENFYEEINKDNKGLYQEILEDAILLAGGSKIKVSIPSNQVLISNLDSIYSELLQKKALLKWSANVYPELAAELLLYHQSKFVADGVYAIIDIGGGTVDMALFQKLTSNHTKISNMYCLAQKVLPYGIEILHSNITSVSRDNFQNAFCSMLMKAKDYMDIHYDTLKKIDIFFLGGGAYDTWYTDGISETRTRLKQGGVPDLFFSNSLEKFIESEEFLIRKNQRLIISQMLARHADDISNVMGFPDFYEQELKERDTKVNKSLQDVLYERGSKYWD